MPRALICRPQRIKPDTIAAANGTTEVVGQREKNEELIFDLAGNVAESVIAADGSGKTLGGSAGHRVDSKS